MEHYGELSCSFNGYQCEGCKEAACDKWWGDKLL
jgi:hypothetical protein